MSPVATSVPNSSEARRYKIAVIPGDGIGPETIGASLEILQALQETLGSFQIEYTHLDWSSDRYFAQGKYLPDDWMTVLKPHDAIFFGAVGHPKVPDHISLWELLLPIRQRFQQYANLRPTRIMRGVDSPLKNISPESLDWMLVRENTEGEYAGQGGRTHIGQPWEVGTELAIFTRQGIERIFRFAYQIAESRSKKHLTFVTKSNAQRSGMVLWDEVAWQIAAEFPHVKTEKMLVDAMTVRMVHKPESLDTIVATNLHADILSDLAAAIAGSIGIAPASSIDPTRQYPSTFESVHGSAPDIAGRGIANPIATMWAGVEMLRWLGEEVAADAWMKAIEDVCAEGVLTPDLGGKEDTRGVTDAIRAKVIKNAKQHQMAF
ncbi:tartrate dehydrogenase [Naematelia encephala]|uniref:D-malate dehydrogenase (decarboxylating) n=1 Tax=Naematelia encephala TaxID=71784 RepID=A0A1Y2B7U9_9TREE|nr:tartrate dehydrogenase [Naematelia encephala]